MIVLDASAVVQLLVGDPPPLALAATIASEPLHAPSLLDYEVASALRGHSLGGRIDDRRLAEAVHDFAQLDIERHSMVRLLEPMLDLRTNFTVCDAAYVVLAIALEARLVTLDAKLLEARRFGAQIELCAATTS